MSTARAHRVILFACAWLSAMGMAAPGRAASPTGEFWVQEIPGPGPHRVRLYGRAWDPDFAGAARVWIHTRPAGQEQWHLYGEIDANQTVAGVGDHAFDIPDLVLWQGRHEILIYVLGLEADGRHTSPQEWVPLAPGIGTANGNPDEHPLLWDAPAPPYDHVRVIFNRKFGGAITKLHYSGLGAARSSLVDGEQAGAMFQCAFWYGPRHEQLPPGCPDRNDMWWFNPTQAGFVGDGWAGNPIGVMGTTDVPDPAELWQPAGNTLHFKSRFIRYDYCQGSAPMERIGEWDTPFYIEQRASFHPSHPRTLVLETTLSYVGAQTLGFGTRQLPVIFAFHLPRVAFMQNGQQVVWRSASETSIYPDQNWAALLAADQEAGIGMVYAPCSGGMDGFGAFGYGASGSGQLGEPLSVLYMAGGGLGNMAAAGTFSGGAHMEGSALVFPPNSAVTWTIFDPIGPLDQIRQTADSLLASFPLPPVACDDGDPCTYGDSCAGTRGCVGTPISCASSPGPCGAQRSCNGTSTCSVTYPAGGVTCDDGNLCTYGDRCNGAGSCAGTYISCDHDPPEGWCTRSLTCDGTSTCAPVYAAACTTCYGSDSSTGPGVCDGAGSCVSSWPGCGPVVQPAADGGRRDALTGVDAAGSDAGIPSVSFECMIRDGGCPDDEHGTMVRFDAGQPVDSSPTISMADRSVFEDAAPSNDATTSAVQPSANADAGLTSADGAVGVDASDSVVRGAAADRQAGAPVEEIGTGCACTSNNTARRPTWVLVLALVLLLGQRLRRLSLWTLLMLALAGVCVVLGGCGAELDLDQPAATRQAEEGEGCAFTAEQDLFGVNVWVFDASYVPDLVDLGARWIRLECCFDHDDPSHAHYRNAIDQVHAAGSKVLLLVDGMVPPVPKPAWNASDEAWDSYRVHFNTYLEQVAGVLGPEVDAWEVWNEPDHELPPEYGYDPGLPAHQFGYLLRDAATIIRRHSDAPLVVGGLATKRYDYFTTARDAAGGLDYDGLGVHTYCPIEWTMDTVRYELDLVYSSWHNVSGLPLWVTEAGGLVVPGNDAHAAEYVQVLYQHTRDHHLDKVRSVLYFTWRDTQTLVDRNESFGLVDVAGARRPGFATFAALSPEYSGGSCDRTPAPVPPPERTVRAVRADAPLLIDGDLGEWSLTGGAALGSADYVALQAGTGGDHDLSAQVYFMWSADYLYVGAVIADDYHVANQAPQEMWRCDSLQVALDADHDHTVGAYDGDADSELGMAALSSGAALARWQAPAGAGALGSLVAARNLGGSVVLEAALPVAALGLGWPAEGDTLGMSFLVNDDDGAGRDGWVEWTPGIGYSKDPSLFGHLVLGGGACETSASCAGAGECAALAPSCGCPGSWTCNSAQRCEWLCQQPDAGSAPIPDAATPALPDAWIAASDAAVAPAPDAASPPPHDAAVAPVPDAATAVPDTNAADAAVSPPPSDAAVSTTADGSAPAGDAGHQHGVDSMSTPLLSVDAASSSEPSNHYRAMAGCGCAASASPGRPLALALLLLALLGVRRAQRGRAAAVARGIPGGRRRG